MLTKDQATTAADALAKPRQEELAAEAAKREGWLQAAARRRKIIGILMLIALGFLLFRTYGH